MLVVLAVAPFILLLLIFLQKLQCWRRATLASAVVWGVLLTFITEFLSIPKILNVWSVSAAWGIATVFLAWLYVHLQPHSKFKDKFQNYFKQEERSPFFSDRSTFFSILPSLIGIVLISATLFLIAVVAPPNTWDSMTYHMSRVMHWMQNQSVEHYPTALSRQLDLPPWAEFAILHLQVLTGGDRLANLVQWFSMIGCLIGVSLIAQQMGANLQGQVFAAITCATIPMGILQASSTQNDYVITFWLVCFVSYFLLTLKQAPGSQELFILGASLGLACLTKATAYFYCLPFVFLLSLWFIRTYKWRFWKPLFVIGGLTLILNISHWWRNFSTFGKPLGVSGSIVLNEKFGISYFVANFIRNIGLHFPIFSQKFNDVVESFIYRSYDFLFKADLNDPGITFWVSKFHIPVTPKSDVIFLHEDFSGNPTHLLLLGICLILFLIFFRRFTSNRNLIISYSMSAWGGLVLMAIILKWTGFESRYHVPLFVLLSVIPGIILSKLLDNRILQSIALVLALLSTPYLLFNVSKPLMVGNPHFAQFAQKNILQTERNVQYFTNSPGLMRQYQSTLQLINSKECHNIGLLFNVDSWEYPLWALLPSQDRAKFHIQHVNVTNNASSTKLNAKPYKDFEPCLVVGYDTRSPNSAEIMVQSSVYRRTMSTRSIDVYLKQ